MSQHAGVRPMCTLPDLVQSTMLKRYATKNATQYEVWKSKIWWNIVHTKKWATRIMPNWIQGNSYSHTFIHSTARLPNHIWKLDHLQYSVPQYECTVNTQHSVICFNHHNPVEGSFPTCCWLSQLTVCPVYSPPKVEAKFIWRGRDLRKHVMMGIWCHCRLIWAGIIMCLEGPSCPLFPNIQVRNSELLHILTKIYECHATGNHQKFTTFYFLKLPLVTWQPLNFYRLDQH